MRVFVDANAMLDALLRRHPWHAEADEVLRRIAAGAMDGVVSSLSLAHMFYVGRKQVGAPQALTHIMHCLQSFEVASVGRTTIEHAIRLACSDFEDGLQLAAAVEAKVDAIVTRNPKDFANAAITVLTPADLLARTGASQP